MRDDLFEFLAAQEVGRAAPGSGACHRTQASRRNAVNHRQDQKLEAQLVRTAEVRACLTGRVRLGSRLLYRPSRRGFGAMEGLCSATSSR